MEPQRATGACCRERRSEAAARVHIVHPGRQGDEAAAAELRLDSIFGFGEQSYWDGTQWTAKRFWRNEMWIDQPADPSLLAEPTS